MTKPLLLCLMLASVAHGLLTACSSQANTAVSSNSAVAAANANTNAASSTVVSQANEAPQASSNAASPLDNLKTQARELSQTIQNNDFARLINYTHPKAVETLGGRDKVIAESRDAIAALKREGIEIASVEVGDVKSVHRIGDEVFAVVPLTAVVKSPQGKTKRETALVGISSDNGANWRFVSNIAQAEFAKMFPAAANKIKIPADTLTPFTEN